MYDELTKVVLLNKKVGRAQTKIELTYTPKKARRVIMEKLVKQNKFFMWSTDVDRMSVVTTIWDGKKKAVVMTWWVDTRKQPIASFEAGMRGKVRDWDEEMVVTYTLVSQVCGRLPNVIHKEDKPKWTATLQDRVILDN
jgi:hypothetical protein